MQTEIILYSVTGPARSEKTELNPFHYDLIKRNGDSGSATICVIAEKWLDDLQKNKEDFEYRGKKHPKKQLTYYFRKTGKKFLVVNGSNYSDFRQFRRSINDFLNNAVRNKLHSLYFIAISEEFFELAKEEASQTFSSKEAKKGNHLNPLLNMMNNVETTIDLKERYIGNSEPCMLVRQMIGIASQNDFPVLVLGETGTGKEVVARNIHECSNRGKKIFISVNCSAIPTELFESELFGYKAESHSMARKDKKGLWEVANNGTLFLDEIGDLASNHQTKILKAIEDKEILPIGAIAPIKVNVRIIAATNKNIGALATKRAGGFRDDLYYRISTFIIRTPPLSSHPEDIPELAVKMWGELSNKKLSHGVLDQLRCMSWPGNVRLLKHFLERLHALFGKDEITEEHVEVLKLQDLDNYLRIPEFGKNKLEIGEEKDFERAIMKIEYLLKASLYTSEEDKRRELLDEVKECLEEIG